MLRIVILFTQYNINYHCEVIMKYIFRGAPTQGRSHVLGWHGQWPCQVLVAQARPRPGMARGMWHGQGWPARMVLESATLELVKL